MLPSGPEGKYPSVTNSAGQFWLWLAAFKWDRKSVSQVQFFKQSQIKFNK
jgi:hypothetical protein